MEVPSVKYDELADRTSAERSKDIRARVEKARKIQEKRFAGANGVYSNSQMTPAMMNEFCQLGETETALLKQAFENLGLSARAHNRILKVARTIADLSDSPNICAQHLAEAIQYRSLDRKYW